MYRNTTRRSGMLGKAAFAGLASVLLFASANPAFAQRAGSDDEEEESPSGVINSERTAEALNEAIELLNMENYAGAQARLAELRLDRLSPYERSRVEQIFFQISYASERYDEARGHLEQAIAAGGLAETEVQSLRYQIAQTFMVEERWREGAQALEEWFRTAVNPNSAAYYLLAVAYYQMEDFGRSLPNAERAISLAENPQESWVQLVLALYIQEERWSDALPLLQRLVAANPGRKSYWMQLSSVHGQLEQYGEALATMQLAYEGGLLDQESEYMRLTDLLIFNDVPYRGGTILEAAIARGDVARSRAAYQKLADAWIGAREYERALEPLETAADMAPDGDLFVRLAEVHMQRENWSGMANALRRAIDKGGLRDGNNAQLLMGVALFQQDRFADARPYFERAARSESRADQANTYIQLIDQQLAENEAEEEAVPAEEEASDEAPADAEAPAEEAPAEDAAPAEAPAEEAPAEAPTTP